ncbi:MAG: beta-N-acetylhexosaminidase [Nocardioidaceae bacterium]|nr:beta-N-acetylhexosaminidase [Nocardioidaceae bacterium]
MVAGLGVRELAGQVIVATYAGTAAPVGLVEQYHLGGVIVMSENAPTVEHAARAMAQLQHANDRPYPLWLSVDQEGGIVARLGAPMTAFPTYMSHGAARDRSVTTMAARASGEELRGAGFTVVYAPVADVTTGPSDPTIGSRSAGSDPTLVGRSVAASVRGYRQAGIVPVIKHFPGHGSVPQDSHEVLAVQPAPLSTLKRRDLVPFQRSIDAGAPAVMVGHIDVEALDAGLPSSLSHRVVTGLLRHRLGFRGVVVTDALNMAAVVNTYGAGEAAVLSLLAGDDVLLMPTDIPGTIGAIVSAVHQGRLPRQRLEQAAQRMIALLLHQQDMPDRLSAPGVHSEDSLAVSRAAVTQASGPCGARLVGDAVAPSGDAVAVALFTDAARQAGLTVDPGTTVHFVGYLDPPGVADIVVSTDAPYALGPSTAGIAKIALFGQTPAAMRALVEVLMAERTAPGRLPVDVDGVVRRGC